MLETGFKGSDKDFTYHLSILRALKVPANGRILDFGANRGYGSWQFARAGFDVESFEISKPRARFGKKLGLTIHTDINEVGQGSRTVYSCHACGVRSERGRFAARGAEAERDCVGDPPWLGSGQFIDENGGGAGVRLRKQQPKKR